MGNKTSKSYTAEFKEKAIGLVLQSNSLERVAKELGIPHATLSGWLGKFKQGQTSLQVSPANTTQSSLEKLQVNMVDLMVENKRLNKIVAQLLEEKAILKKAAAYFAQELK
jgi:transposase